jgi:hypothetical protein
VKRKLFSETITILAGRKLDRPIIEILNKGKTKVEIKAKTDVIVFFNA